MILNADGSAITPGNVSFSGGVLRQKPDVTAADGVSCAAPGFNPFFGTSAAAPHAAAIAALVKSFKPGATPTQVRTALTTTALDIMATGVDRDSGFGIVMAKQALASKLPPLIIGSATPATKRRVEQFYSSVAQIFESWIARHERPYSGCLLTRCFAEPVLISIATISWKSNCLPSSIVDRFTIDFESC